jgi:hypothetical protein
MFWPRAASRRTGPAGHGPGLDSAMMSSLSWPSGDHVQAEEIIIAAYYSGVLVTQSLAPCRDSDPAGRPGRHSDRTVLRLAERRSESQVTSELSGRRRAVIVAALKLES